MNEFDQAYGDLIRIDPSGEAGQETLRRIPLGTPVSAGGIDESSLRDLLFEFPGSLPVGSIDAAYTHPVPVCRELSTPAGYVDAVYVNALGRLVRQTPWEALNKSFPSAAQGCAAKFNGASH